MKRCPRKGYCQCFCSAFMVHPGLTEGEEREVTEDNKKEGKGRKPRRKNCLCCQNFTNLGLSQRAEGPCAEVGAQTNDLCWVQCQQLLSHTDLVLICSKAEKTKKMNPKGSRLIPTSYPQQIFQLLWRAAILTLLPDQRKIQNQ